MRCPGGCSDMSLKGGGANAYRYEGGIEFGMTSENGAVRIRVCDTALDDLESQRNRVTNYLKIFERNRYAIENAARRKYDAGAIEKDGSVLIKTLDLNR
jgi:hypothetical protein